MKKLLIILIKWYRKYISPLKRTKWSKPLTHEGLAPPKMFLFFYYHFLKASFSIQFSFRLLYDIH